MDSPDPEFTIHILDGKQFLGSRAVPTTYGHDLVHYENDKPITDLGRPISDVQLPHVAVTSSEPDCSSEPLFHRPESYIHYSTLHSPYDIIDNGLEKVIYEIDSDDEQWLTEHGVSCDISDESAPSVDSMSGSTALNVISFEWIIQWLERKAFMEQQRLEVLSARHTVQYDDTPCAVCRLKESTDLNQIVICDECDLAVHQRCYGVRSIPDGIWLCDVCALNLSPNNICCDFCGASGGAFKTVQDRGGKVPLYFRAVTTTPDGNPIPSPRMIRTPKIPEIAWAHVQCALWLPYASFTEPDCFGPIELRSNYSKSLNAPSQCMICLSNKGGTVKCAAFECRSHFHVLCGQKKSFVIIKDSRDRYLLYCDHHTPEKYQQFRKDQLKTSTTERQSKLRKRRINESATSSLWVRTASRHNNTATPEALKYWSGLLEEPSITEMRRELEGIVDHQTQNLVATHMPALILPNEDVCRSVFRHWTSKRTFNKGLPLLKSFHHSVVSNSAASILLQSISEKDLPNVYNHLLAVRNHLIHIKRLVGLVIDREQLKQKQILAKTRLFENLISPTRGAQLHILHTVSTDFDTSQLFLASATTSNPLDWSVVMRNVRAGKYDHDATEPGGGSFVQDLLAVVDTTRLPPHLHEVATAIRDKILQLTSGSLDTLKKNRHPLSIVLPVKTVLLFQDAMQKMRLNDAYKASRDGFDGKLCVWR